MNIRIEVNGEWWQALPPRHIAIPMQFDGPQPGSYGVAPATATAYEQGGWIGDVRRGGSCNFETYTLTPHCNGTHTECGGHISAERLSVHHCLNDLLVPAVLCSIQPHAALHSGESYDPAFGPEDHIISRAALEKALAGLPAQWLQALVVRTLPNPPEKQFWQYPEVTPAFFSSEAMRYIRQLGVRHLLVDLPSVDRLFDEGKLSNHHIFWDMPPGGAAPPEGPARAYSITEFIYVPDDLPDGRYLLALSFAPFASDAAPSRPQLFPLERVM